MHVKRCFEISAPCTWILYGESCKRDNVETELIKPWCFSVLCMILPSIITRNWLVSFVGRGGEGRGGSSVFLRCESPQPGAHDSRDGLGKCGDLGYETDKAFISFLLLNLKRETLEHDLNLLNYEFRSHHPNLRLFPETPRDWRD